MTETFLLTSEKSNDLFIEQLHINLWILNSGKFIFDIGMLLSLGKILFEESSINLCCYHLFQEKKASLQGLYANLTNEETLQIVFNDEVSSTTNIGNPSTPKDARLVRFKSKRKFIIFNPLLEEGTDSNKTKIQINLTSLDREAIINSFEGGIVSGYLRFRYEVDIKKTSNIFFDKRLVNNQMHLDFRFNEPRLFDSQPGLFENLVHVKNILIFTIQPAYYRSRLQQNMKYIRFLEKDRWGEYINELDQERDNFLVYYWRSKELPAPPDNEFNMLVSFEVEKVDYLNQLLIALILILISYLTVQFSQSVNVIQQLGKFSPLIQKTTTIIAGGIVSIGLGIVASAIYDYLKQRLSNKHSKNRTKSRRLR